MPAQPPKRIRQANIGGGTLSTAGLDGAQERTVNMYPIIGPTTEGGGASIHMQGTEGLELWEETSGSAVRGMLELNGIIYFVVGSAFKKKIVSTGVTSTIGTITTSSGDVDFAYIYDQIALVDGVAGWVYTISTTTLAEITDVDFHDNVTSIAAQDGVFIAVNPSTQAFYISTINNGASWSSTAFGLAQANGDYAIKVTPYLDELYVFGVSTTQKFINTGNVDFQFEAVRGATLPYGLAAERSVATGADSIMWLGIGINGKIKPIRVVSNQILDMFSEAILKEMQALETFSDARAFCYQSGVHEFYVLTFPSEDKTYVFDLTTGLSHDRTSTDLTTGEQIRWRPHNYVNSGGRHFVGDFESGNIFELKSDVFDEDGEVIFRRRRIPIFDADGVYKTVNKITIQFALDEALTSGQGSDPQVMLKISHDGGHTFGNEMWRSIGTLGEFTDLAIWDSLGTAKKWCLEITMSDPIEWKVLNAWFDIEIGDN